MFDYEVFKKDMTRRGHEVKKNGRYITIAPNNNYIDYAKGFRSFTDVVAGYEDQLEFVNADNFNTWIYSARFRIV